MHSLKASLLNKKRLLREIFIPIFLLTTSFNASAAWLSICDTTNEPETNLKIKHYFNPDGSQFHLVLTKIKPLNCQTFEYEINETDIKWMEIINKDIAMRLGNRVTLQGITKNNELKMSEIIPQDNTMKDALSHPILLNINLLNELSFRTFGIEERASFKINQKRNEVTLTCNKGQKPAGLLFNQAKTQLPLVKKQMVNLHFESSHNFPLAIADQRRFNKGNPIPLGNLLNSLNEASLPIPREKLNHKTHIYWSILCPKDLSNLKLTSLSLSSEESSLTINKKSMWFWKPSDWLQDNLKTLSILKKYKAEDIFISVILNEATNSILNEDRLSNFISLANKSHISVWVVEGDPHVVLPAARKRFARRARIFSNYNKSHPADQQLSGIQYDIEPYLISGYSLAPEKWASAYIETIRTLKNATNMPLEIVIPFWWQNQAINGKPMLSYLSEFVASINVMNYRTTKDMINRFAEPLLDWGMRNQTPINIALEAGPIADETQWRYQQQNTGELWSLSINQQSVLLLNHKPKSNPSGESYKLQFERVISGNNVTFESNLPALKRLLPELNSYWSRWSSFNGISLHGLED